MLAGKAQTAVNHAGPSSYVSGVRSFSPFEFHRAPAARYTRKLLFLFTFLSLPAGGFLVSKISAIGALLVIVCCKLRYLFLTSHTRAKSITFSLLLLLLLLLLLSSTATKVFEANEQK